MVTELKITSWKAMGSFTLDGQHFIIEPSGFLAIRARLMTGSTLVASAEQPSIWGRSFRITSAGKVLTLESRSLHGRKYSLLVGSREVGTVKRVGFRGKKVCLDLPDEVPLPFQVFLMYLVLRQAKRDAAAGSAGAP